MYTKEEKKELKKEFWNGFGIYMKKYNRNYGKIRWVNYRSNIKDLYFRLEVTKTKASFSIEMQHKDDGIRELFFEQFLELKNVLTSAIGEELKWEEISFNQFNHPISTISLELINVSLFNKNDWRKIFVFFEKKMIGLHQFWSEFKEIFKQLEK